ncbi:MAG: ABC transporter permease [Alphaproteobacteria bacterium]|nr:ABC transporter permease [Alphaproteobacteria bacterium]
MRILALIAFRNLVQARTRTTLLGTAIALVMAMLVLLLSLAGGIEDNLVFSATMLSSGHVTVAGFHKSKPTDAAPLVTEAAALRKVLEANTPGLDYLVERQRGWAKVISPQGTVQSGLSGIDPVAEWRLRDSLHLAPESDYVDGGSDEVRGTLETLGQPGGLMLFANQAKKLHARVGDTITIQTETQGGQTNTIDLQVTAVARDVGLLSTFATFMSDQDVRTLYQLNEDTTGAFWLYLKDIDRSEETMNHLRTVLEKEGYVVMDHVPAPFFFKFDTVSGEDWVGQRIDLTTWEDEVSFLTWILTAFDTLTWMMSVILLAIIAVGIMNALYNAVRERTRELGTLRAIGMTRRQVLALVLLEALLLGLMATGVGAVIGSGVALTLDAMAIDPGLDALRIILLADQLHLVVRPLAVGSAIVLLTLLTGVAALWPAFRAARLKPVTAMQHAE